MRGSISAGDLDDALASLKRLGDGTANRALADAMNHTANQARQALRAEMESVFDRPSPWVLDSTRIISARPTRDLEQIEAIVTVKDGKLGSHGFDEWFSAQVYGSNRLTKGSEKMLRKKGVLRPGQFISPTQWTPRDAQGGISRQWMTQVLSGLSAFNMAGSDHNATTSRRSAAKGHAKAFFVIKRGKVPIGIAERRGKHDMKIMLMFTRGKPQYRGLYRFHDVVRRVAENDANLESNINKAITDALSGKLPATRSKRR